LTNAKNIYSYAWQKNNILKVKGINDKVKQIKIKYRDK